MNTGDHSDIATDRSATRRRSWIVIVVAAVALVAVGVALAIGDDPDEPETLTAARSDPLPAADADASTGTIRVQLEPVDGFFIEGFEVGLRFETADGEVIASTLWTDHVASLDEPSWEAYYEGELDQVVPSGPLVVRAEVNVGIGPPPSIPDLEGDLPCRLDVEVDPDEVVTVEVSFDGTDQCLRVLPDEGRSSTSTTSVVVEPVVPPDHDGLAVGTSHYVDVDLECKAFTLGGTWVLVDGDPSTWQPPGERHEGGTFTIESRGFGRFVGDAAQTKVATFRLMGPNEGLLSCMPIPRPQPPS